MADEKGPWDDFSSPSSKTEEEGPWNDFGGGGEKPETDYSKVGWGDVAGKAIENAPASALKFGQDIVQPFLHPVDTAKSLANVGMGAVEKIIPGGEHPHEKYADAVGEYLKDRYATNAGFKKAVAEDPVGVMSDISMVLTGGGSAAAQLPGKLGRVGQIAGTVGRAVDPLMAPVNAAKVGMKTVGEIGTHTGARPLETAYRSGVEGGEAGQAFRDNMRGHEELSDVVDVAKKGVSNIAQRRSQKYLSDMAELGKIPDVLPWDKVVDAVNKNALVKTFKGVDISPATKEIRDQITKHIDQWGELPPEIYHTPAGFDALKQMIGNIKDAQPYGSPQRTVANEAYNAIRQTIVDAAPGYAQTMKNYERASDLIKEMNQTLSLNPKANIDTSLRKLQSIMRNNVNTNYGRRLELGELLEAAGAKNLLTKLSGQALNAWFPRGLGKLGAEAAALFAAHSFSPWGLAAAPVMSPRLMGEAAHATGRFIGKPLQKSQETLSNIPTLTNRGAGNALYRTGRFADQGPLARVLAEDENNPTAQKPATAGFASGGVVADRKADGAIRMLRAMRAKLKPRLKKKDGGSVKALRDATDSFAEGGMPGGDTTDFYSGEVLPADDWADREAKQNLAAQGEPARGWGDTWQGIKDFPSRLAQHDPNAPPSETFPILDQSNIVNAGANLIRGGAESIKSGVTAAGRALSGEMPMWDQEGHTSPEAVQGAFDLASIPAGGTLATGATEAAAGAGRNVRVLGRQLMSDTGKSGAPLAAAEHAASLRPAVKFNGKIIKGDVGEQHLSLTPQAAYDYVDKNFNGDLGYLDQVPGLENGFVDHRGRFLDHNKAGEYAADYGLVPKEHFDLARNGGLTSEMLLSDTGEAAPIAAAEHAQPAPRFYSGVEKGIGEMPVEVAPANQWLKEIWEPESKKTVAVRDENTNKPTGETKEVVLPSRPLVPGMTKAELEHTGTIEWLAEKGDTPVTKDELLAHIAQNKVEVGQVVKGEAPPWDQLTGDQQYAFIDRHDPMRANDARDFYEDLRATDQLGSDLNPTKFSQYQLPGGQNYKEKLLTLPEKGPTAADIIRRDGSLNVNNKGEVAPVFTSSHWDEPNVLVHTRSNEREVNGVPSAEQTAAVEARRAAVEARKPIQSQIEAIRNEQAAVAKQIQAMVKPLENARRDKIRADIKSGVIPGRDGLRALEEYYAHPEIEPLQNRLSELRAMEDRLNQSMPHLPDEPKIGVPSHHIEEIQSDWHQKGRKQGYQQSELPPEPRNWVSFMAEKGYTKEQALEKWNERYHPEDVALHNEHLAETEARAHAVNAAKHGVPDAPFKSNWHELAIKDALADAVAAGKTRISWTPGEAQAARYDLSKQVESIKIIPASEAEGGKHVTVMAKSGVHASATVDGAGDVIRGFDAFKGTEGKNLSDLVGKDVADRILKSEGEAKLEGLDLKVGGEFHKKLYDQKVPQVLNKIGKPHGVKVERGTTDLGVNSIGVPIQGESNAVSYMDIPPSLADQIRTKGFSLFEDSSAGAPIAALEQTNSRARDPALWHGISDVKLPKPISEMSAEHVPTNPLRETSIRPADLQGSRLLPLIGDRSAAGSNLTRVNGFQFGQPVEMQGGHGFMPANVDTGAAWASGKSVVSGLSNKVKAAAETGPVHGVYTAMGERSVDFSHHVSDTLSEMLKHTKIGAAGKQAFNEAMRRQDANFKAIEDWPGLNSKNLREYLASAPGEVRNKFAKTMDTRKFQMLGFPSVAEARFAVTDPRLLHEPTGAAGLSVAQLDPTGRTFQTGAQHRSYDTNLAGKYVGGLPTSIPKELMYPDILKAIDKYRRGMTGYVPTSDYLMARTPKGLPLTQKVDQKWVDSVSKFLQNRGHSGLARGGKVTKKKLLTSSALQTAYAMKRQG